MVSGFVSGGFERGDLRNLIVSAAYLVIGAMMAVMLSDARMTGLPPFGLMVIALGGCAAWFIAHRRYHLIHDTPTSTIRGATQGYVELAGRIDLFPGEHAAGFASGPPSVWYTVTMSYRRGDRMVTERRRSHETFLLRDGTGACVIDPDHAEIVTSRRKRWRTIEVSYDMRYLAPGDPLYALGELTTLRPADTGTDLRADANELLRSWKADKGHMQRYYDADGDGEIDMREWEKARADAERIASSKLRERQVTPGVHIMRAPRDGRPFLLSNRDPESLATHYKWWAWFHLAMFVSASGFVLDWLLG
jgi:hypothetical protein